LPEAPRAKAECVGWPERAERVQQGGGH